MMSKPKLKPGILSKKRLTPVHNLRSECFERLGRKEDYSWAVEQIRQFEAMLELEDMENDRAGIRIFGDAPLL